MNRDGGRLNYVSRLDNSSLRADAAEASRILHGVGSSAEKEGQTIDAAMKKIGSAMVGVFAISKLKDFAVQVANVRGEFQQLEVAFNTMLQSKSQADALMNQLIKTAATTPFGMSDIANSAKQLLAYGVEADKVNDTLIRLGDIAAGLSIPINDLAYLYGTTMVQGRMYTADLNQFLGRGIPLTEELAKQFGVTKNKVKSLVEEGKVGFPEVEKAIIALTSEGGKFGGLMAEQSKTITGQISNIEDAIEQMFNELGKKSEGFIAGTLEVTSSIVENWESIGKALLVVLSAYGAYKAAVIAVAAAHKIAYIWGEVQAFLSLTKSITSAKDAMLLLNMATKANPIGLILGVVAAAATAFGLFRDNVSDSAAAVTKYGEGAAATISRVNTLSTTLNGLTEGTTTHTKVMEELNGILEEYGLQAIKEGDSIDEVNRKREQAIQLIKDEALERQRLNALEQGELDYSNALSDAKKQLYEDLQGAATGYFKDGVAYTSANKELQDNAAAISQIISDLMERNISLIAGKTGKEYEEGINKIYAQIQDRMRAIGISETTLAQTWSDNGFWLEEDLIAKYINSVREASEQHDSYTTSINKATEAAQAAADAGMTYGEKTDALARKLRGADDDAHGLYKRIQTLMSQYQENTIGFTIKFNAEVPAWMNNKDIPELKRLAEWFTSHGAALADGGTLNVNGQTWTKQQLLQRGADYAQAAENKQQEADKKQRDLDATEQDRKRAAREAEQRRKQEEREAKQIADQTADRTRQIHDYYDAIEAAVEQGNLDIRQRNLELMEEGFDRELEQLNINYARLLAENTRREQEMLEALADNKVNEWLNKNPKATKTEQLAYRNSLLDPKSATRLTRADLKPEQQAMLQSYDDLANQFELKGKQNLYKRLLAEYQDYETRRTETNKKFDADRAAIEADTTYTTSEQRAAAIAELERQRTEAIKAINNEEVEAMQKSSSLLVSLFADASDKSTGEINKIITETKQLLSYLQQTNSADITPKFGFTAEQLKSLKDSPEKIKAITEQVKKLQEIANKSNPFKALADAVSDLFSKPKEGEQKVSLEAKLKKTGEAASECADMIGGIAGKLSDMFEEAGNQDMAEAMSTIEGVMGGISNIASGFAQGGMIGGIAAAAGEAINLIGSIFSANARHAAALKEIQKEVLAQQKAYNLALLEQRLAYEQANTVFGNLDYSKAANAVTVMKDAYAALREEIEGTAEQQKKFSYKSIDGGWIEKIINKGYSKQKDLYSGLADISIKTGHKKTGLFGWGKGKDIYSSILDVYPELIDKQGNFNRELAESILNTRTFQGEGKEALQAMIDLYDQAEAAFQEVKDYLTGIFGDLGNTMSDALVDAFKNGTDAAEAFGQSVADMLESLGQQMIFSTLFSGIIQQANDKMLEVMTNQSLTEEQKFNQYIAILDAMTDGILGQQDNYNDLMQKYQQMAANKGVTLFEGETPTREASSKGIATASQESVDELNGRATAIQGHTFSIAENTKLVLTTVNAILKSVLNIESNTNDLPQRMAAIESNTKDMRATLSDISLKGVRIKN